MASQITRCTIGATLPLGATFLFCSGTVLADGAVSRPNPAAVYAEPDPCKPSSSSKEKKDDCERILDASKSCEPKKQRDCKDTELERWVMTMRQELGPYKDTCSGYTAQGVQKVTAFYDRVLDNVCYLRTGAPQEVRIGTIVAGGLTGLLLGIRGGFIKKIFMGSVGAGGGAYLAYPNETEKYSKKYTAIAYNFIAGPRK